jgi:hypothetical protein
VVRDRASGESDPAKGPLLPQMLCWLPTSGMAHAVAEPNATVRLRSYRARFSLVHIQSPESMLGRRESQTVQ